MALSIDLFDYELPAHLIAQQPASQRDASRLLVVDRSSQTITHKSFKDLPDFLQAGDRLFRNSVAVLPARLIGQRPTGGKVECFLLHPSMGSEGQAWWCLVKPGRKLPVGATFHQPDGAFSATIREKAQDGSCLVEFSLAPGFQGVRDMANRCGLVPLPPYIGREDSASRPEDLERYQTVYANRSKQNAVAAPTAGLHFTPEVLQSLQQKGLSFHDLILHVGLGTFRPVTSETIEGHDIHRETYEVPLTTQQALFAAGQGRRLAVGTTSLRAIEDFLSKQTAPLGSDFTGESALFVYPPARFRGVDALLTNFHQPKSTLLCLVSAFLSPGNTEGIGWMKEIYAEAIREQYRFFSYGDAMLIL